MAQHKRRESLIAEIPKPRLTDEELMEMFYGGDRKNTKKVENDDLLLDSYENTSAPLPNVPSEINKPDYEPISKEPSPGEPIFKEPSQQDPINHQPYRRDSILISASKSSADLITQSQANKIIASSPGPPPLSKSEEVSSPQSPLNLKVIALDDDRPDTNVIISEEVLATQAAIGSLEKGSIKEGSHKEGSFKEGLFSPNAVRSPGEVLKKAFDVLPMLSPLEQLLYLWFLNMSHEVGRESCRATMSLLQRATGISEKLVRENIRSLLRKGCLNLMDGGIAGKAALYRVALPERAADTIIDSKGSDKEGSSEEPSQMKPTEKFPSIGNLPKRNLPSHIERESFSYTLSNNKEPSPGEGSDREGSLPFSLPTKIADNVIDRFYSMTGQTRISRQKRERSRLQLLDLIQQGFQVDDVLYAIEWARGNISGPIHSFGLIPEIIGQAISQRSSTSQGQKPREDRSTNQRTAKSDIEVAEEQKEHERLVGIYTTLSSEEQNALRSEALHLVETEYGSHVPGQQTLVRLKLMEILRARYVEQS